MKRLATLFADSYREVKNIRTITVAAMFAAISVALGYFTIQIGDYIKIGFSSKMCIRDRPYRMPA